MHALQASHALHVTGLVLRAVLRPDIRDCRYCVQFCRAYRAAEGHPANS